MALGKYCKVDGVIKAIVGEYTKVGGVIKAGTINAVKVGDAIREISVAEKTIFACEQSSANRLYALDGDGNIAGGWPVYGGDIAGPYDVACDGDNNSYWACANNVYKINADGAIVWTYTGFTVPVTAICVDVDGNVYAGDSNGNVKKLNSAGSLVWSQVPYVGTIHALAVDYSEGQLYSAYGEGAAGGVYRFLVLNGNGSRVYYNASANMFSIAIDEVTPSLYVGDNAGNLRKMSTAGYVYWTVVKSGEIYAVRVGHNGYGYYINGSGGKVAQFALSSGSDSWSKLPGGTSRGLAVDRSGNVYTSHGPYGTVDAVIRKHDAAGVEQWAWQPYVNSEWRGVAVSPGIKAAGF
jgi:hypothetical protein